MLARGLVLGFSIAAVVGPIALLSIRRTLSAGFAVGFVSGLGAATADASYAAIAGFGISAVATVLVDQRLWLRLAGGLFLVYLALRTIRAAPPERAAADSPSGLRLAGAYSSTLVLTVSNPLTILSFAAIFAGLGLGSAAPRSPGSPTVGLSSLGGLARAAADSGLGDLGPTSLGPALALVLGVFVGSAAWWLVLASVVARLRTRLTPRWVRRINLASGLIILAFGVQSLVSAAVST